MISTNFINECKNRANGNRLGQIVVNGLDNPITQSNNLQSFEIDSGCYVDGNIIGSVYSKCLKANFIADQNNLVGKYVQALAGVKYADLSTEYVNMGEYKVERPNNEITAQYSQITAYDNLYTNLDSKYVCNIDYSTGNKIVSDLYADVCSNLGLIPKTLEFINSTIPIYDNPFTNGEKNRTVLQTIAKISCSFVDIDNDTNIIDLCWLSSNEEPDYVFNLNDYSSVEGGQIVCGPINCLIIKNSQVDDENLTIKDDESIKIYGENSIIISDDYILHNAELRQQAINYIWNRVKGMKYVDCKLTTYYGKPFLKLGAKIRIYVNDTDYFDTYVLKHNFTYDGSFTSVIESPALTKQEIKTKQDISLGQKLSNTQIDLDKQKKKITALVEETSENTNKISKVEQKLDTIEQQISGEYGMTKEVSGNDQVFIEDALKYYPLELKISGFTNMKNLLYPNTFYPGASYVPLSYNEPKLSKITICVDSENSNKPTENLKEYSIEINEPLRSLKNIKDELKISISSDGTIVSSITRYLKYTGSQVVKLDNPIVENIDPIKIELLEHSNYIYIKEQPNYQLYVKYLIYSEMNEFYATKVEMNSKISQTESSITQEVNGKYDTLENNINGKLELKIDKDDNGQVVSMINASADIVELKGNRVVIDSTNFKADKNGNIDCNNAKMKNAQIVGGNIEIQDSSGNKLATLDTNGMSFFKNNTKLIQMGSQRFTGEEPLVGKYDYLAATTKIFKNQALMWLRQSYSDSNTFTPILRLLNDSDNPILTFYEHTLFNNSVEFGQPITGSLSFYDTTNAGVITTDLSKWSNLYVSRIVGNGEGGIVFSTFLGDLTVKASLSDKRLKKNIKESSINAIDEIKKIKHYSFDWKENNKHINNGYIAQELEKIDKDLVIKNKDEKALYQIDTLNLLSLTTKAIQEQQEQIESLQKQVSELKEMIKNG